MLLFPFFSSLPPPPGCFVPGQHTWQGWVSPRATATTTCTANKASCARGSSEGAAPGVPMSLLEAAAGREQKDLERGCVAASAPGELSPGVCGVGTRAG